MAEIVPGHYDKGRTLLATSVIVLAVVAAVAMAGWWFARSPRLAKGALTSITVALYSPAGGAATSGPVVVKTVTVTNQTACSNIIVALREGRLRRDHTCSPIGGLNLQFASGKTNEIQLLPRHGTQAEFRLGVLKFRTPNNKLYDLLVDAGLDEASVPDARH